MNLGIEQDAGAGSGSGSSEGFPSVLAVDTSTTAGGVAIVIGRSVVAEFTLNVAKTHSSMLMPAIELLLKETGVSIDALDAFAVSVGPGSFTGLRIGIATVKGLAMGAGKPIARVSTLDALANNVISPQGLICPMIDARKGEVYGCIYRMDPNGRLIRLTEQKVCHPASLLSQIEEDTIFVGNGAELYRWLIKDLVGPRAFFVPFELSYPRASTVARMGSEAVKRGDLIQASRLAPLYIRRSDAEMKRESPSGVDRPT